MGKIIGSEIVDNDAIDQLKLKRGVGCSEWRPFVDHQVVDAYSPAGIRPQGVRGLLIDGKAGGSEIARRRKQSHRRRRVYVAYVRAQRAGAVARINFQLIADVHVIELRSADPGHLGTGDGNRSGNLLAYIEGRITIGQCVGEVSSVKVVADAAVAHHPVPRKRVAAARVES